MNNNSPTEAGQTENSRQYSAEQVDTINQVFALLRLNYHNQYYKAFSNTTDLNAIKRMWIESLQRFHCSHILQAVKRITENEEFLPTLATIIKYCEALQNTQIPEVHSAYREACRAPSPKANVSWSHPIIYYAGKKADWYFLQCNPEHIAFPVFKAHYLELTNRLRQGEQFQPPASISLPQDIQRSNVDAEENKKRMAKLRQSLGL